MNEKVFVPPIKTQGIKTKLVGFITENIKVPENAIWYEPFMGSGVVGFNVEPRRAVFSDINPHVISLYQSIQTGKINHNIVRKYLEQEGELLRQEDDNHYYKVRERFNQYHDPLDFLFLNRSNFNGMIRFNRLGAYNVPYGHKRERFSKAYITKIVNQVKRLEELILNHEWEFRCSAFEDTVSQVQAGDFVYCDPPYIGRHVDYYDRWGTEQETALHNNLVSSGARFMVSTWDHNGYRTNEYVETIWGDCYKVTVEHYYHVGGSVVNRHPMVEALLMNYNPSNLDLT